MFMQSGTVLRKYVANSITLVGFCRPILTLMNTPEDIFEYVYLYIVIIFLGIPFTFLYNILLR